MESRVRTLRVQKLGQGQGLTQAGNIGGRQCSVRLKIGSELVRSVWSAGQTWSTEEGLALGWVRHLGILWQSQVSWHLLWAGRGCLSLERAPGHGRVLPSPKIILFVKMSVILRLHSQVGWKDQVGCLGLFAPLCSS